MMKKYNLLSFLLVSSLVAALACISCTLLFAEDHTPALVQPKAPAGPPPTCDDVVKLFATGLQDVQPQQIGPREVAIIGHAKCQLWALIMSDNPNSQVISKGTDGKSYTVPLDHACMSPTGKVIHYGTDTAKIPVKECLSLGTKEGT